MTVDRESDDLASAEVSGKFFDYTKGFLGAMADICANAPSVPLGSYERFCGEYPGSFIGDIEDDW